MKTEKEIRNRITNDEINELFEDEGICPHCRKIVWFWQKKEFDGKQIYHKNCVYKKMAEEINRLKQYEHLHNLRYPQEEK